MFRNIKKTEMIQEAEHARYLFHFLFVAFVVYVIMYATTLIKRFIMSMYFFWKWVEINSDFNAMMDYSAIFRADRIISIYGSVFAIILALLFVTKVERRSKESMGLIKENALIHYLWGLLVGFGMFLIVILALLGAGVMKCEGTSTSALPMAITLALGFLLMGAAIEIVFRGFAFTSISATYNILLGIIVNAVMYAVVRYDYFNIMLLQMNLNQKNFLTFDTAVNYLGSFNIVLFSIFVSLYVLKTKNLWGAMAINASWFIIQANIFGLNAGGMEQNRYSLFYFSLKGNDIITGGKYGLEGSILITVLLIIAIGVISFVKYAQRKSIIE